MTDTSPLGGLLIRADNVFSLAWQLGRTFHDERRTKSGLRQVDPNCWDRHQPAFNEFCAAVLDLRDAMQNPPEGFGPVAKALLNAAGVAKRIRDRMQTVDGRSWAAYLDYFPELNSVASEGGEAVNNAVTKAMHLDDPFAFVDESAQQSRPAKDARAGDQKPVVAPQAIRTPAQLLEVFASAAAKFPACPRMFAFLNSANEDGLVTVPSSFVPRKEDGRPVVGQLNIGGTSKSVFGPGATFYGVGSARIASESVNRNVGFVLYGAGNDEAATTFRELGNEAGLVVHVHELVRGIQCYDRPLVLWCLVVYETLQGSKWLSQIDGITENPALHFNPFLASVETLKRLLVETRKPAEQSDALPAVVHGETKLTAATVDASLALMRVFTNGIADNRIHAAARLLADDKLTSNEKLTEIDALIHIPASASAEQLGGMLGVSKQAILKTDWWIQNRKGEKESEVGRRRDGHRKRAKNYERPGQGDDE